MALLDLLKRPEGKTLEIKRDLTSPVGALRTIVAFANTAGGVLLLGVEDRTVHVRGVHDALDLEERVANLISDSIAARASTSNRCRNSTRKQWTSERLPSRSPGCGS